MITYIKNPPSASSLLESMRDIGYSLETALADLVDNSISADARIVEIYCIPSEEVPYVAIIDDGYGMCKRDLLLAMQHGGVSTKSDRTDKDLGRFGLGLKTASFSQCRSLTVISKKKDHDLVGLCWDLDLVADKDDWILKELTQEEISMVPHLSQLGEHGTIVLWQKLDRLLEGESTSKKDELVNAKLDIVRRHLSLVFHRFLDGQLKKLGFERLELKLNGTAIEGFDPFCTHNLSTQVLPQQVIRINDSTVTLTPYILPHHSRLTASEYDFYQDRSDFISNQGAYVYRNGRLMAWGDWFRLVPKGEATKLARVKIDFNNDLDDIWTIDIKKSRAQPPRQVRDGLRQIIQQVSNTSVRVHRGRGEKYFQEAKAPFWEKYADKIHGVKYDINREHPMVVSIKERYGREGAQAIDLLLDSISSSVPIEMIYSDYSTNPRSIKQYTSPNEDELKKEILEIKDCFFRGQNIENTAFLDLLLSMPKYKDSKDAIKKIFNEV